ncbi:MAG: phosphoribosylformylglycinamidine synthase subunit PurS, partial [Anaerolineae bacterium]
MTIQTVETVYRVQIAPLQENGRPYLQTARQLGITNLNACHASRLIFLQGSLSEAGIAEIAESLLVDPVVEELTINSQQSTVNNQRLTNSQFTIETVLHPGVTDPPAENLVRAAHRLGFTGLQAAATGHHFALSGDLSEADLHRLATEVFANPVIQHTAVNHPIAPPFIPVPAVDDTVEIIPIRDADDARLTAVSQERRLALDLVEMQAIQAWFQREGRDPSDVELEMLAQTWSEHCVHKTFKAVIDYTGPDGETETIDGLLNSYIRAATEKVNKPWVRSAFVDNAGIVAFDDQFDLAFKVETHNHPSALEPFGGA